MILPIDLDMTGERDPKLRALIHPTCDLCNGNDENCTECFPECDLSSIAPPKSLAQVAADLMIEHEINVKGSPDDDRR